VSDACQGALDSGIVEDDGGFRHDMNIQIPISKHQRNSKHQISICPIDDLDLVLGIDFLHAALVKEKNERTNWVGSC
jgi:hypothetical protein